MPGKEQIQAVTRGLPVIAAEQILSGEGVARGQIWCGNELGAEFVEAKVTDPEKDGRVVIHVMLYGLSIGQEKLGDDFINALGTPEGRQEKVELFENHAIPTVIFSWDAVEVEKNF